MRKVQSTIRRRLDQAAEVELEPRVPPHAQNDHLAVELPPSEQLIDVVPFSHRWPTTRQEPMYPMGVSRLHHNSVGEDGTVEYTECLQATGKDNLGVMPMNACYGCCFMRSASTFL
jgi:hypothetical protein